MYVKPVGLVNLSLIWECLYDLKKVVFSVHPTLIGYPHWNYDLIFRGKKLVKTTIFVKDLCLSLLKYSKILGPFGTLLKQVVFLMKQGWGN